MLYSKQNLYENYFIIGPLTLDICNKLAYTNMGTGLFLSPCQFDMLHALALKENEPLSFHDIFDASHKAKTLDISDAFKQLYELIQIIKEAGLGFMWIEKTRDNYCFVTKWNRARAVLAI